MIFIKIECKEDYVIHEGGSGALGELCRPRDGGGLSRTGSSSDLVFSGLTEGLDHLDGPELPATLRKSTRLSISCQEGSSRVLELSLALIRKA